MLGPGPGVEMLTRVTTTTLNTEHWTPRPVTSRWRIGQPGHQGGCLARARTRASQHKRTFPRHSNHPWEISSKAENQWLPVRSHSFMLYLQLDTHLNFSWQTPCFPDSCYLGKDKFPNPGESIWFSRILYPPWPQHYLSSYCQRWLPRCRPSVPTDGSTWGRRATSCPGRPWPGTMARYRDMTWYLQPSHKLI